MKSVFQSELDDIQNGVDFKRVSQILKNALEALAKEAEALKDAGLFEEVRCKKCGITTRAPMTAKEIAQTMAYCGKMIDEMYRLSEFAAGHADSRPEMGGGIASLLPYLTNDQFSQLENWVRTAKAKDEKPGGRLLQ